MLMLEGRWLTELYEILKVAGPWGGPVVVFGLLYARGYLATGRELRQLQEELTLERAERTTERAELRQELSFWRELAWSTSRIADQVVGSLPPKGQAK